MWESLFSIIERLASGLITLFGVWLGWKLNAHLQWKQRRLDRLTDSFKALREIINVTENIPPDLGVQDLQERLAEEDFRRNLSGRIVRLFGLRSELIPFLDYDIVEFIDNQLRPLYIIEIGTYNLREDRVADFAVSCLNLRQLSLRVEKQLIEEYESLRK